jgi:hypothetical protein
MPIAARRKRSTYKQRKIYTTPIWVFGRRVFLAEYTENMRDETLILQGLVRQKEQENEIVVMRSSFLWKDRGLDLWQMMG